MDLHEWWIGFGRAVEAADRLTSAQARDFAAAIQGGKYRGVILVGFRCGDAHDAVHIEIDVERPQDLALPIRAIEPIAIVFGRDDEQPRVLALRKDFPDTPHQNWTPQGAPCSLCVDDRPWLEAKLTSTPFDLIRRVQLWLARAARGELHDSAQPLDPLFFRSSLSLVIPPSAFSASVEGTPELIGFTRQDNPAIVLTANAPLTCRPDLQEARFLLLAFKAAPQSMSRLRHAPTSLTALHDELTRCGVDLLKELKSRFIQWAGTGEDGQRKLNSRLIVLVIFPVQEGSSRTINDIRAFVAPVSAGDVAVAIGALLEHPTMVGGRQKYSVAIGAVAAPQANRITVDPAEVHFSLNRDLAAAAAGSEADRRKAVLVGAGALGSHIGLELAREGVFSWTVLDQDVLMPHNFARHALLQTDTGAPKALALARQIEALLEEPVSAARGDVTKLGPHPFTDADIIIDASASVAVSRFLSDMPDVQARRFCTFFNPAGNAVVLLAEDKDRCITLRDLEAQYHDLLLSDPGLADHLSTDQPGLRYSGSCRALTSRIPATRAALLSPLAAHGITDCLPDGGATIRIWTVTQEGEVRVVRRAGSQVSTSQLGSWKVTYDAGVLRTLREYRVRRLPRETGGVLLGIIDVSRRSIHVAHAMPQAEDSRGSVTGFERGVIGLADTVADIAKKSLHQLRYVGEWHSHPAGSTVMPSRIDVQQLAWLASELEAEGVPALMAIAGSNGAFSFMVLEIADRGEIQAPDLGRRAS